MTFRVLSALILLFGGAPLCACGDSSTVTDPAAAAGSSGAGSGAAALHCAPASAKPAASTTQTAALCAAERHT